MKRIGLVLFFTGYWLLATGFYTYVHAQQETLEILTYYPAPYGVYQKLDIQSSTWDKIDLITTDGTTTRYARIGATLNAPWITTNARWDSSASAWTRDSTGISSFAYSQRTNTTPPRHEFDVAPAATGNITWTTAMVIETDGDVGIGTTTDITERLTINGNIRGSGGLSVGGNISVGGDITGTGDTIINTTSGALTLAPAGGTTLVTGNIRADGTGTFDTNLYVGNNPPNPGSGGLSVGGNISVGGDITGTGDTIINTTSGALTLAPAGGTTVVQSQIRATNAVLIGNNPPENASKYLGVEGNVYVNGFIQAGLGRTADDSLGWNTTHQYFDVGELIPCTSDVEIGDVVTINQNNSREVMKCSKGNESAAAGIISESPQIRFGNIEKLRIEEPEKNWNFLALAGQVMCNVDASYGEIKPGDLLTTSPTPGHAMKAKPIGEINGYPIYPQGCIVGKALEPLEEGKGKILVLVCLM